MTDCIYYDENGKCLKWKDGEPQIVTMCCSDQGYCMDPNVCDSYCNEYEEGWEIGDICNREGCQGILDEDGDKYMDSCSCHINPPCSRCTTNWAVCPECGWEARWNE